jgi:hypothetical protein
MWVILKKLYSGPLGFFNAGNKYDIPDDNVEQLRKELGRDNVVNTCAPWEEHVDKKALRAAKLLRVAQKAIAKVSVLKSDLADCESVAARIKGLKKEFEYAIPEAQKLAKAAGIDLSKNA